MARRSEHLQRFVDAARAAFGQFAQDPESRRSIARLFAALDSPGVERAGPGCRLPVCSHLDAAFAVETEHGSLRCLIDRFAAIEPLLAWHRRPGHDGSASGNFADGHANAMIVGPGGVEERRDLWLGVTLMAPNVRYPDHDHAPEEVYLVLSEGEFRRGAGGWFAPGTGGSFYNEPAIRHAMRSLDAPFLAFWACLVDGP
jgi:hypothetical protein